MGRPDMSRWLFTSAIIEVRPIDVFNHGKMRRDFTYINDIAEGTVRVLDHVATPDSAFSSMNPHPGTSYAPYRVYNIGNNHPVELMTFIRKIENALGVEAKKNFLPMQDGDVIATYADVADLMRDKGFVPMTSLETGIVELVEWYKSYQP